MSNPFANIFRAWVAIGDRAALVDWLRFHASPGNGFLSAMRRALYREGFLAERQEQAVRAAKHRADTIPARNAWLPASMPRRKPQAAAARA